MNFYVSKSGNEWKIKQTEIDTDVWKVKYLPISDTYYVIVQMVPGSRHIHTIYGQALFEGMRAKVCEPLKD